MARGPHVDSCEEMRPGFVSSEPHLQGNGALRIRTRSLIGEGYARARQSMLCSGTPKSPQAQWHNNTKDGGYRVVRVDESLRVC